MFELNAMFNVWMVNTNDAHFFILSFCQLIKSFQIKDCLYESLLVLIMTNIFPFDKKWNQLLVTLTSTTTFTLTSLPRNKQTSSVFIF